MEFKKTVKRLWGLSLSIAEAEFKLRNEGSYLGILWYLLEPLLMFILLLFVFSKSLGQDIPHYPLYLLVGIIVFNFFQKVTLESTRIIRENRFIIKSISFPLESLAGSTVLKTGFGHGFEVLALSLFLYAYGVGLKGLILYPLILIPYMIFILGVALTLSALTVYFTDLQNIWVFASRLLWFATPIFYEAEGRLPAGLNQLNPLYYFITASRRVLIYHDAPQATILFGVLASSLLSLAVGAAVFNKLKPRFAELI